MVRRGYLVKNYVINFIAKTEHYNVRQPSCKHEWESGMLIVELKNKTKNKKTKTKTKKQRNKLKHT